MGERDRRGLRVALVLKTSEGGLWALPHVDELRSRGHDVVALLPAGPGRLRSALAERGVPVVNSAFDFSFRPRWSTVIGLVRLRRQVRGLAPDVLHYHLYASALAARLAGLGLGAARVHMVAGPLYLESPVIRAVERVLVRLDTVTIAGSAHTAERYRALGRRADRVATIPYGVDTERNRPMARAVRDRVRAELGIGPTTFVVAMVAFVYAPKRSVHAGRGIKGHDVLLHAWRQFHPEHPDSHLLLVGAGFDDAGEEHREQLIEEFGVGRPDQGVTWVRTTTDVRPYYAAADVSVSPSLSENHGAALEAGAMGLPSIVTDAGALAEAVPPDSGWVVGRGDAPALLDALRRAHHAHLTGALRTRGERARAHVEENFDRGRSARAVADVIEDARDRGHSCRPSVTVFTEARFGRDRDGRYAALEPASGASSWSRYERTGYHLRLVGRVDQRFGSGVTSMGAVDLIALPHYVGPAGLVRRLPALVVAVALESLRAHRQLLRVPGAIGSIAAVANRLTGRRYAVEVVGDPYDVLRSGAVGVLGRLLAEAAASVMRWSVRGASASRFVTGASLQARYPPRAGTASVVVSNVDLPPWSFAPGPRSHDGGSIRLITIGSQEQTYKGHDVLLKAVRRLMDEGAEPTVTIVGGGRLHSELIGLAERLGLGDRVTFTGVVTDRLRLIELLDAATVFVMPSRTEGLPRALVEAMSRGLPAVGSRVGGIPELLAPSCLVPVDDDGALAEVISDLARDEQRWEAQSRRNLAVARQYDRAVLDRRFDAWLAAVPVSRRTQQRARADESWRAR